MILHLFHLRLGLVCQFVVEFLLFFCCCMFICSLLSRLLLFVLISTLTYVTDKKFLFLSVLMCLNDFCFSYTVCYFFSGNWELRNSLFSIISQFNVSALFMSLVLMFGLYWVMYTSFLSVFLSLFSRYSFRFACLTSLTICVISWILYPRSCSFCVKNEMWRNPVCYYILRRSPLIRPLKVPFGWHEFLARYWNVSVVLVWGLVSSIFSLLFFWSLKMTRSKYVIVCGE